MRRTRERGGDLRLRGALSGPGAGATSPSTPTHPGSQPPPRSAAPPCRGAPEWHGGAFGQARDPDPRSRAPLARAPPPASETSPPPGAPDPPPDGETLPVSVANPQISRDRRSDKPWIPWPCLFELRRACVARVTSEFGDETQPGHRHVRPSRDGTIGGRASLGFRRVIRNTPDRFASSPTRPAPCRSSAPSIMRLRAVSRPNMTPCKTAGRFMRWSSSGFASPAQAGSSLGHRLRERLTRRDIR